MTVPETFSSGYGFLATAGETGALIAAYDWTTTPLGPLETWPQSLRTALGLILHSPVPIVMLWGEDGVMMYNDAYSVFAGGRHPRLLGSKVREGWPEVADFNDNVMKVGLAGGTLAYRDQELTLYRYGRPEQVWMNLDYSPVLDESGRPAGVIAIVVETTEQVLAERRQAFLFELSDRLRDLAEPEAAMATAAELLGRHLTAGRVGYGEVEGDGESAHVVIGKDWCSGRSASIAGCYHLRSYAAEFEPGLRAGQPIVVADFAADPRTAGRPAVAVHLDLGVRAQIVVPLVKAGRLAAVLFVHTSEPRQWSSEDVVLVREVGERTWAAVERARAEARLRESEARFREIADAAPVLIWLADSSGSCFWFNKPWLSFSGRSMEEEQGFGWATGVHPADLEQCLATYNRAIERRESFRMDYRFRRADGAWRVLDDTGVPRFGADGAFLGHIGSAVDVTEARQAEADLRRLNETLEQRVAEALAERRILADIVEGTDAVVQVVDPGYRWLAINRAAAREFERIFGIRPKVGDSMLALLADKPEHQAAVKAVWSRALAGEEFTTIGEFGDPDLERRHYEMTFNTLRGPDGERIGAYQFVYDVTERLRDQARLVQAEEALRQSQKMEAVGQLTGGVAHDFNNLLTIIRSSSSLLLRPDLPEERRRRYIDVIVETVDRAAKLTSQLLAFARRQALKPEVFDVAERISALADMLRTIVGARIRIQTFAARTRCLAEADVSQFETAIVNMAVNACDAMQGEGILTIRTEAVSRLPPIRGHGGGPGGYIAVSVADTGSGIRPEALPRIFDPFFTTKEVGRGTGLGLSQVYGFAKQSGGDVAVESELGRGTTFTLYLPRIEDSAVAGTLAERSGPVPVPEGGGRRVLVVEDNLDVGRFSTQILQDLGYETTWAVSGAEALDLLDRNGARFDVVFSDVVMPGMSGIELGGAIRRRYPGLPVVLTSGYSHVLAEEGRHGFELLQKPYAVEELSQVLQRVAKEHGHTAMR